MSIHRYDTDTWAAAERLAEAEEDYRLGRRPAGLPGFYRRRHYFALTRDRTAGLHWLYATSQTAAICTCGLLLPAGVTDLLASDGHLDPRTDHPTQILVIHAAEDPSAYTAACQACGWQNRTPRLGRARSQADQHATSCTAPRAGTAQFDTPHP